MIVIALITIAGTAFIMGARWATRPSLEMYPATRIERSPSLVTFYSANRVVGTVDLIDGWVCSGGHCERDGVPQKLEFTDSHVECSPDQSRKECRDAFLEIGVDIDNMK